MGQWNTGDVRAYLRWIEYVSRHWHPEVLPPKVVEDTAVRVAIAYASYGDAGKNIYVSIKTIATEIKMSPATIKVYRAALLKFGILRFTGTKVKYCPVLCIGYAIDVPADTAAEWRRERAKRRDDLESRIDKRRQPLESGTRPLREEGRIRASGQIASDHGPGDTGVVSGIYPFCERCGIEHDPWTECV